MNIFMKTGLITFFIFTIGLAVGLWLDVARSDIVEMSLAETSLELTDVFTQNLFYDTFVNDTSFCKAAIRTNLEFNDRIYEEGVELERLETVNKLGPDTLLKKKRYALLQTQFWLNAVKIKETCDADYDTVIYLYENEDSDEVKINQRIQSTVLTELKNKCGNQIMLIPLPGDINISAINLISYQYDLDIYPSILINEKTALKGVQKLSDLEQYVAC